MAANTSMVALMNGDESNGVASYTICGGGLTVEVLDVGAAIRDIRLEGVDHPLVLGLAHLGHYPEHSAHMGAIAGRVANRIAGAKFRIDGTMYEGPRNLDGRDMLHGGPAGFGTRRWSMVEHTKSTLTLQLHSPAGEADFPGDMTALCTYECSGAGELTIALDAVANARTLVNLAPHTYFNLDDSITIDAHELLVHAPRYTPVDHNCLPNGEVLPVNDDFDFLSLRPIGAFHHDQNYCVADTAHSKPATVAALRTRHVSLEVRSTAPGLQLYTGDNLDVQVPGLGNRQYGRRAGVCLETQSWPDAVHHSNFPSIELGLGEHYQHVTQYVFAHNE
jgi:aldose 1-epimerase